MIEHPIPDQIRDSGKSPVPKSPLRPPVFLRPSDPTAAILVRPGIMMLYPVSNQLLSSVRNSLSPELLQRSRRVAARPNGTRAIFAAALLSMPVASFSQAQSASLALATQVPAPARQAIDDWGITRPNWLAAASLSAREGYDSNIYGVSNNLAGHPAIADVPSWFTTLSASFTFDLLAAAEPRDAGWLKT